MMVEETARGLMKPWCNFLWVLMIHHDGAICRVFSTFRHMQHVDI